MSRAALHRLERHAAWLLPCLLYLWAALPASPADGRDLMPFPDAEEYALIAARLARAQAPLLTVGMHEYPSRYSPAFPLLLTPFVWLAGFDLARLHWSALAMGLAAVFLMARVGGRLLGSRLAGGLAAALWALHPQTAEAARVVMSETAITMMFFAMLALARPWLERGRPPAGWARAAALGLVLGWLTLAKAPFAYWAVGLSALVWLRGCEGRRLAPFFWLVGAGTACLAADLAYRRWAFGAWGGDGYAYWVPSVYSDWLRTFHPGYLITPWSASSPGGNLETYGRMLLGLTDEFYSRYMPLCAAVAGVCLLWPRRRGRPTRLVVGLMAGWAAVGALFCGCYFYQSPRFPHLWTPVLDLLLGWGLAQAPAWTRLRRGWAGRRRLAAWGRLAALLAAVVLLRGEARRVREQVHQAPAADRVAYVDQIRPLLDRVPEGAWLLTNYQLPLVQFLRPHPSPTAALNVGYLDGFLLNPHLDAAWQYRLEPFAFHAPVRSWIDPIPAAWLRGPTLAITPEDRWALTPDERRALFARPAHVLVVIPPPPMPTGEHFEQVVRPMLEPHGRLQPIQAGPNVTLYRLGGP